MALAIKLMNVSANANVLHMSRASVLFSYETPVAALVPGRGYIRTTEHYSKTTSKHINQWIGKSSATVVPQSEIDALLEI